MRNNENNIDPLRIELPWHDFYPKLGLNKRYVGDGYMLCSKLPTKDYLRQGAKFRLLGNARQANLHELFSSGSGGDSKIVQIDDQSALFSFLCNGSTDGSENCSYPSIVVIPENQVCNGTECDIESLRIVRINDVYYEYVQPPCVHFSFFTRGKLIRRSEEGKSNNFISNTICAKRDSSVAAETCCDQDTDYSTYDTCKYTGERLTFPIAKQRCKSQGKTVCNSKKALNSVCGNGCCNDLGHYWTGDNCELSVYVDSRGKVAIDHHDSEDDPVFKTYFRVDWKDDGFPTPEEGCNNVCQTKFQMCYCSISVTEYAVFSSAPSRDEVISKLRVGGAPPHLASYTSIETLEDVVVYLKGDDIDKNTVFEVSDDYGRLIWLQNMESRVQLGNEEEPNEQSLWFRNSPQFFDAVPEER